MSAIDIIVTCYNKARYIAKTLKSVQGQEFDNFHCYVINDGSTDNSEEVILNTIKDNNRFTYVLLENSGVANARNYGISLGNAPFVCCLDGDDGLDPLFLKTCYNAMVKEPQGTGIVYTDALLLYEEKKSAIKANWTSANPQEQFEGRNQVPCCNVFRRTVWERLGYRQRYAPQGAGAEDAEFWLRFFKLGYTAKKISNEPLFLYNMATGATFQKGYTEPDWLGWHTTRPFASLQRPDNGVAHIVNEYDEPDISVIIPVGPRHKHLLVDALDSLEAQTYQNWEAIVVFDDGTQYDEYYEKAYPYVKFVYTQGKTGAGYARNRGAEIAKGKYLTFLDCDDYLQPEFLELTKQTLETYNAAWVYTDIYAQLRIDDSLLQQKIREGHIDKNYITITKKGDIQEILHHVKMQDWNVEKLWYQGLAAVTCLYRKLDFIEVGGFEEKYNREDFDFHLRLAKAGKCGLRLPLPLMVYRQQAGFRREYRGEDIDAIAAKETDIRRLRSNFTLEELKMGCTSCKKNKVKIVEANSGELETLKYIGNMTLQSATFKGATGKRYKLDNGIMSLVHPQDAEYFMKRGMFTRVETAKPTQPIAAPVSKPTTPVKTLSAAERLKAINDRALKASQEARRIADAETERMLKPCKPKPQVEEVPPDNIEQDEWWQAPENYTIAQIKQRVGENKDIDIQDLRDSEAMGKGRSTLIDWLDNKIASL